jgi:hypothetical protein
MSNPSHEADGLANVAAVIRRPQSFFFCMRGGNYLAMKFFIP